jgi:hypothetical protein
MNATIRLSLARALVAFVSPDTFMADTFLAASAVLDFARYERQ